MNDFSLLITVQHSCYSFPLMLRLLFFPPYSKYAWSSLWLLPRWTDEIWFDRFTESSIKINSDHFWTQLSWVFRSGIPSQCQLAASFNFFFEYNLDCFVSCFTGPHTRVPCVELQIRSSATGPLYWVEVSRLCGPVLHLSDAQISRSSRFPSFFSSRQQLCAFNCELWSRSKRGMKTKRVRLELCICCWLLCTGLLTAKWIVTLWLTLKVSIMSNSGNHIRSWNGKV
jgi:hypothetical protein